MQAGFAMVETGFTRAKNSGNIIMKNLMDFSLGTIVFYIIGFGLMFGTGKFIGTPDFFVQNDYSSSYPTFAFLIFQTVFCATAATIVSGAMAERTKFSSYCIYSIIISALIYPISGHWIWGGGWLAEMGFHDFAGSTAVHMVGGVAAIVGAKMLGPRIGKFSEDGKAKAIPGHSLTLGALGVFILWFCWFGFNGGSTVSLTGDDTILSTAKIFITTNLAAAVAATTTMCVTWIKYKKPDVSMTLNGALAGLVGITAGCDAVSPLGAIIIGILSGIAVVYSIEFVENKLKIDDPVGAFSVHGVCGALGTILTGFLAVDGGLLYGGGASLLITQIIGVAAVIAWVAITMAIVFTVIKKTVGLRVSAKEEIAGLDLEEHGLDNAYADFMPIVTGAGTEIDVEEEGLPVEAKEKAVKVVDKRDAKSTFTKIVILTKRSKFPDLKKALNDIEVTGLTLTNVMGCGMQKGVTELYRGVPVDMTLLPKIKVEVVVSKVPVKTVVETVKNTLYTGHYGDGKMFIYNVDNVIKVRTGEEGYAALQED
jgi:Amt family ammonium transporter